MGFNVDRVEQTNSVKPVFRNDIADQTKSKPREASKASENGEIPKKKVNQAVDEFEKGIETLKEIHMDDLSIEFDKEADMKVVKIIDQKSGEVLKEIPPKEIVELAKKLNEMLGILFDKLA